MITMRDDGIRATKHTSTVGPPQYVPPALRHDVGTHHSSFQQIPWSQKFRRDPPPHKDSPACSPRPSDSPNWCVPSPNCPTSCRSPSPPPQPLPMPSVSLSH